MSAKTTKNMSGHAIDLCPGFPPFEGDTPYEVNSGVGRVATVDELGEYMKERFSQINERFGSKATRV